MNDIAIRVENLGKLYKIGVKQNRHDTLRDKLTEVVTAPFRRLSSVFGHSYSVVRPRSSVVNSSVLGPRSSVVNSSVLSPRSSVLGPRSSIFGPRSSVVNSSVLGPRSSVGNTHTIWALKDVSFEVKRGEVVGVIGRNGAGKTTLLKILSRITEPTEGHAEIHGRVSSLLEVGTGFHPELSGRENIYLNAAILGMKKAEIERKFDEIVAFAETEKFLDTPVKHYSSGMYVRLAFAVAAHLEPEILLVDEVLAVGDATFQKKCLGKMGEVAKEGRTVLFVSHNMAAVQKLCPRALLLKEGKLALDCESAAAIRQYMGGERQVDGKLNVAGRQGSPERAIILDAWLEKDGIQTASFLLGDTADLIIKIEVWEPTLFSVELMLRQAESLPVAFAPSGLAQDWEIEGKPGVITVIAQLPPMRFARGNYAIDIMLAETEVRFLDYVESAISFSVDSAAIGKRNWGFSQGRGQGYDLWDVRFSISGRQKMYALQGPSAPRKVHR